MIFVIEFEEEGQRFLHVKRGEELNTDHYARVNKIFFCETEEEAQIVVSEFRNWDEE